MNNQNQIAIYEAEDGQVSIEVKVESESIWLSQKQMAELFDKDSDTIGLHLKNIFNSGELEEKRTTGKYSVVQQEGTRQVQRKIKFYNLDAIISVGYRVNSKRGTQFRIWATKVLNEYLIKGYTINERRLKEKAHQLEELKKVVQIQEKVVSAYQLTGNEAEGLIMIIADYTQALDMLDDYDHQRLALPDSTSQEVFRITYNEAKVAIQKLGEQSSFKGLFGKEKDDSFKGSLENIYQTFDGKDLYPSVEEKAAHLLYFVTKNHSFSDGNKRIAAFLFVWFLERNGLLIKEDGTKRIPDNTLVALTLMIAESNPNDKDMMVKVVVNLLVAEN